MKDLITNYLGSIDYWFGKVPLILYVIGNIILILFLLFKFDMSAVVSFFVFNIPVYIFVKVLELHKGV